MTILSALDLASVFVFALTGALAASRAQLDMVGFAFLAALTAVGGGTLRDLTLGRVPVFWVADPRYLAVAALAALLVYLFAHRLESRATAILWLDALALAVAVSAGVSAARAMDAHPAILAVMGVATGTIGGLARDVVCNEVPLVLRKGEIYATAALAGALANIALFALTGTSRPALLLCIAVTFCLRAGSIRLGWRLPTYRSRPPRR